MSGRGNCYDNAVVESFFRTLKTDLEHRVWATRTEARTADQSHTSKRFTIVGGFTRRSVTEVPSTLSVAVVAAA